MHDVAVGDDVRFALEPHLARLLRAGFPVPPGVVGEGKHLRFRVKQGGRDAGSAIAFGLGAQLDRMRRPVRYALACRLKENRWNGTIAPGTTVNVGYVGNYAGPNVLPGLFTLNGTLCTTAG